MTKRAEMTDAMGLREPSRQLGQTYTFAKHHGMRPNERRSPVANQRSKRKPVPSARPAGRTGTDLRDEPARQRVNAPTVGALLSNYAPSRDARSRSSRGTSPSVPRTPRKPAMRFEPMDAAISSMSCAALEEQSPRGLGATCWFDARSEGEPYDVDLEVRATPRAGGTAMVATRTIRRIPPGVGRVAYTTRIGDVAPGEWDVQITATEVGSAAGAARRAQASGSAMFLPFARETAPGMSIGAWPLLVALGAVLGTALLAVLSSRRDLPTGTILALAAVASLTGLIGAKAYFLLQSRTRDSLLSSAGMCIQGYVLAAFATVALGSGLIGVDAPVLLDLAAPGLMLGIFVGRFGCWRGGCCAGRPAAHRWALWSTDRTLGIRRIPVQLIEGAGAGLIGAAALAAQWVTTPRPAGLVFVAVISSYVLLRQALFPLRDNTHTRRGRLLAYVASLTGLVVSMSLLVAAVL